MQTNIETVYTEHHSRKYSFNKTYKPCLIDNMALVEGETKLEEAQVENKHTSLVLEIVQAAIIDSGNNNTTSPSELDNIKSYYETDPLAFEEEALPIYLATTKLYDDLTERQCKILYKYVVERYRVVDIANYYNISAPGVLKTIKLIRKKALKLHINNLM